MLNSTDTSDLIITENGNLSKLYTALVNNATLKAGEEVEFVYKKKDNGHTTIGLTLDNINANIHVSGYNSSNKIFAQGLNGVYFDANTNQVKYLDTQTGSQILQTTRGNYTQDTTNGNTHRILRDSNGIVHWYIDGVLMDDMLDKTEVQTANAATELYLFFNTSPLVNIKFNYWGQTRA